MTSRRAALLVVATFAVGGCGWGSARDDAEAAATVGGEAGDVLADAETSLAERRSGRLDFALRASAEDTEPVGFEIEGPYSFEGDGPLATLDLTYSVLLGEAEATETRVVSTGEGAWLVAGDEVVTLDDERAAGLHLGEGGTSAVPDLALSAWVADPEVTVDGDRTTVSGAVDAPALLSDLQRLAAEVGGETSLATLDAATAERLESLVRASEITVETVGADHDLRAIRAVVDFGSDVPERLREVLGRFAGARIELDVEVGDLDGPLDVRPP